MNMKMTRPSVAMTARYGRTSGGKMTSVGLPGSVPEQRGPQDERGGDLGDDGGLPEASEEEAHQPGDEDDQRDVEQHDGRDLLRWCAHPC